MCCIKFNGFLQEILENPHIDVAELIQNNLSLPYDKAETLACRVNKKYLQTTAATETVEQRRISLVAEKPAEQKPHKACIYNFESLSNKEFEVFTKWFLQELGYSVTSEKVFEQFGVDLTALKNDSKTVILARKYRNNYEVSEAAILLAQQAKIDYQCEHAIFLITSVFSEQAKIAAEKCNIELWDVQRIYEKILEIQTNAELTISISLPKYEQSLFNSLMSLAKHKVFLIEERAGEKYDLFFPGVKFPLLTFQVQNELVTRLVFRIKYNEPVGENVAEALISYDKAGNRFGPKDVDAYEQVIGYLEQFLE
ncbi:MAG: restriction endonuclease [Candidatus Bathyarchaeota archaeon]|nr:restriction endonuclease [Candidatus Termiticorpusculum sp.]